MFAIIRTGGKQYRVEPGTRLKVERLAAEVGARLEFEPLLVEADRVLVGTPTVPGARVIAEVVAHGRGRKVRVAKFKAKVQYRRVKGHRQPYTELLIREIQA
jgi:large subunit ribosomal protein L21